MQSDRIRNSLLQDTFAIRRSLELSLASDGWESIQSRQGWLSQIEQLHSSLEALSDALTPPYLEDSLPLALQALLESWRSSHPEIDIHTELPSVWAEKDAGYHSTLLSTIDELLNIALSEELNPVKVRLTLQARQKLGELSVQVTYPDRACLMSLYRSQDLTRLIQVFQFLTSGWCSQRQHHLTALWHFSWRLPNSLIDSQ